MLYKTIHRGAWAAWLIAGSLAFGASTTNDLFRPILAVGSEGTGNLGAAAAWRSLVSSETPVLLPVLQAMDSANDLALNWLRSAAETIVDRDLKAQRPLPLAELRQFLEDTKHHPRARRLAFEMLARFNPAGAAALVAGMVNDPSPELRRDAVQKLIDEAHRQKATSNAVEATSLFRQSLGFARDVDQIDTITTQLRALGQTVDLPRVFGFLMRWKAIGPFDNRGGKGFETAFPPEEQIDLNATYHGKTNSVQWVDFETLDERGVVSMNKPFGSLKGVAAYALAEFFSDETRPVELRLGSENAWKLWCNGKYVFGQNEYHQNKAMDQFIMPVQLEKGRNLILVKVCQNEQTEDWAGDWDFQLRVCDAVGTPVYSVLAAGEGRAP